MRGKVSDAYDNLLTYRITPAYAGKRASNDFVVGVVKDHPRLCGEKRLLSIVLDLSMGSPPPMRGKVDKGSIFAKSLGITPAYAGKRRHAVCGAVNCGDHPRLCGEKSEI